MKKIFALADIFIVVDYVAKVLVSMFLETNESLILIKDFFSLTYVKNTGAAFSIFSNSNYFLAFASIFFIALILYYLSKRNNISKLESFGYGLLLGGACGNLIDRIVYGYVIDFLDFKIFGYNFPIFNLADTFIVISIIIIILEIKKESLVKKTKK